ncbi:MAG: hypothetical protein ABIH41_03110 [Nanoarchaeota archaeon]
MKKNHIVLIIAAAILIALNPLTILLMWLSDIAEPSQSQYDFCSSAYQLHLSNPSEDGIDGCPPAKCEIRRNGCRFCAVVQEPYCYPRLSFWQRMLMRWR